MGSFLKLIAKEIQQVWFNLKKNYFFCLKIKKKKDKINDFTNGVYDK